MGKKIFSSFILLTLILVTAGMGPTFRNKPFVANGNKYQISNDWLVEYKGFAPFCKPHGRFSCYGMKNPDCTKLVNKTIDDCASKAQGYINNTWTTPYTIVALGTCVLERINATLNPEKVDWSNDSCKQHNGFTKDTFLSERQNTYEKSISKLNLTIPQMCNGNEQITKCVEINLDECKKAASKIINQCEENVPAKTLEYSGFVTACALENLTITMISSPPWTRLKNLPECKVKR